MKTILAVITYPFRLIGRLISSAKKPATDILTFAVPKIVEHALKIILPRGMKIIEILSGTDLTDDEKRNEAVQQVRAELKAKGIELRSSYIIWIVQTLYLYFLKQTEQ